MIEDANGRYVPIVKIQESLYQALPFSNMDSAKKACTSSVGQSENTTDSYTAEGKFNEVEKQVFQTLKDITGNLMDFIDKLQGGHKNEIIPDNSSAQLPEAPEAPVSENDIPVAFAYKKGDAPENPTKTFISYKADKSLVEEPLSHVFIENVVEKAKQFVSASVGEGLLAVKGTKDDGAGILGEFGFVKFSYLPQASGKESTSTPQLIVPPSGEKSGENDGATQASESVNTYRVSGKAIDGQYLRLLSQDDGNDNEFLEKLLAFVSDMKTDTKQVEIGVPDGTPQDSQTAKQSGDIEHAIESKEMRINSSLQSVKEENHVVSIGMAKGSDNMAPTIPIQNDSGFTGAEEGGVKGTTLNTGFGQGELKSSPVADDPLPPFSNDMIVGKVIRFVESLNTILSGDTTVDEMPDETSPAGASLEKLRLLQTKSPEIQTAIQNVAKKILGEYEETPNVESISLSFGKNGLLHLDTSVLESDLVSKKEETLNTIKGFGSTLYDRINYFVHPYAGMYLDDKNILQLRATRKDEGASLLNKQLNQEQGALEKRLNELKLLIERSALLTEWFGKHSDSGAADTITQGG